MPIRVIPVLDLKAGRAVRALAGDRDHYLPLRTRLHSGCEPIDVARGFRDTLHLRELYLADLDAIAGMAPSQSLYQSIRALGIDLWVDAGIRDQTSLAGLLAADVATLVVGLETVRGPTALAEIRREVPSERLVFSLDMRNGIPVIAEDAAPWGATDPFTLACSVVGQGIHRLMLLDLARVGTGRGISTLPLLAKLRAHWPELELTVGGGIADRDEVHAAANAGADAVLIGSALHDGRIDPADLS
jgi:phosphoribosylformimino-5-aminoimidazole carboxamide ribotide isomerase